MSDMSEARIYVSESGAKVLAYHEGEDDSTPVGYDGSPLVAYVRADIADAQHEALAAIAQMPEPSDDTGASLGLAFAQRTARAALAKGDEG